MEWKLLSVVSVLGFLPLLLIVFVANLSLSRLAQELTKSQLGHGCDRTELDSASTDAKSHEYVLALVGMEALYVYALYVTSLFLVSACAYCIAVPYSQRPLALRRMFRKVLAECRGPCTEWFYFIFISMAYVFLFLFLIGAMAKALLNGAGVWAAHGITVVFLVIGFLILKAGQAALHKTMHMIERRYYGEAIEVRQDEDDDDREQDESWIGVIRNQLRTDRLLRSLEEKLLQKIFKVRDEILSWLFSFDLRERIRKPETKVGIGIIAVFSLCIGKLGCDIYTVHCALLGL